MGNEKNIVKSMVLVEATRSEIEKAVKDLKSPYPIRKFTKRESEIYGNAVLTATFMMPAFRDSVALLRPFYDATCESSYVDPQARAGFGPAFFSSSQTKDQRATYILHEAMHVLYGHFARSESMGVNMAVGNIAGDFEINSTLSQVPKADLSLDILPEMDPYNFQKFKSFEQYVQLLKDFHRNENGEGQDSGDQSSDSGESDSENQEVGDSSSSETGEDSGGGASDSGEDSGQSSGNSSIDDLIERAEEELRNGTRSDNSRSCSQLTPERSEGANEIGVEKASVTEQSIAKDNTITMIREEVKKSLTYGDSGMQSVLRLAEMSLTPPKVNWKTVFRKILGKASDQIIKGKSDYSYRRPNRRTASQEFIFKGMVSYEPSAIFGFDTSGSMGQSDYRNQLSEIEAISRKYFRGKGKFKVFPVTTTIGEIKTVKSVDDVEITGGGGTDMAVAFKYINSLSRKEYPDIFILSTDGGTDWGKIEKEIDKMTISYPPIILITSEYGMKLVPESLLDGKRCRILDIS